MLEWGILWARNSWELVARMAPYLLFGFAVAGLLHVLIRAEFVRRFLGKPGLGGVTRACVIGVPMPLCSCSVIPVAASLRRSGASRGATASFLSSTPQTGVDSILATYALLGGIFTVVRVAVAFVCGIVTGMLVDLCTGRRATATRETGQAAEAEEATEAEDDCCHTDGPSAEAETRSLREGVRYGFVTLPADLAVALVVGLVLAGAITTAIPDNLITGPLSDGPAAFLIATLISLPLYVCATASIPMAYAFMAAGLSPGAALVFLITGPATNTATVATVWKMLGRAATGVYIGSLVVISWISGWLFNAALDRQLVDDSAHGHGAHTVAGWEHAAGIALVTVLAVALWRTKRGTPAADTADTGSCCHS